MKRKSRSQILWEGRFIKVLSKDSWEYIKRNNCTGIVIVLAFTSQDKVLLTEQFRIPVGKKVIEFPAGLVNDSGLKRRESQATAAKRELLEETGYLAKSMLKVTSGPTSGGSSADIITILYARGLKKIAKGGGDHTEDITVHEVPLGQVESWLKKKERKGVLVDPKIYSGLYFLKKYND